MSEPIKLPPDLLAVTLVREGVNKHRARDIECWMNEKMALAVEQATADLRAERDADRRREYGYSQETVDAITRERDALQQIVADYPPIEAELREVSDRAFRAEAERDALVQATGASSVLEAIGIIRGNKAQLDRLTTLRPASEWDGETYVLWWREWDVAGWALDSISDSQESFYWTPAFDAHLPRAGGCANSLGDGVVAPSLEPAHPLPTPTEPTRRKLTRDEIIKLAREAGYPDYVMGLASKEAWEKTERFAALVAAAEREACIDINAMHGGSVEVEAAIRAKGEK